MCPWAEYDGSTAQEDVRPPILFAEVRMFKTLIIATGALVLIIGACSAAPRERSFIMRPQIHLTGEWGFIPDVGDSDIRQIKKPMEKIRVPGAWQAQGFGMPGGKMRMGPGVMDADYLRHNLTARCLYVRDVQVPQDWQGRHIWLVVRRAYQYTDAEVNGKKVGEYEGFSTPFEFDITSAVRFGQPNRIVLGVDNRPREGRDLRGTANYSCNWGGIAGDVYLEARDAVWIDDIFAIPDIHKGQVVLRIKVSTTGKALPASFGLTAEVSPWKQASVSGKAHLTFSGTGTEATLDLPVKLKSVKLWSPEHPNLYMAKVTLNSRDAKTVRFGMREIELTDNTLLLNGKPIYLRGFGDDCTEPITGMAPADKALYTKRLRTMQSLGFNFVRHHSMIPHDEYFDAADEVGILVQPEGPVAYNIYMKAGAKLFEQEWPRIITAHRNHPCIMDWCMGNEFRHDELADMMWLIRKSYHLAHRMDPTRPVNTSDGETINDPTDFRGLETPSSDLNKPTIKHEYGDYCCSLPDFSLIDRLKDSPIQPMTYRRAKAYLDAHNLSGIYPAISDSSFRMLRDAHKHYMEGARLDRPMCMGADENIGYAYWLGHDFWDSPEGCWDEGVTNQFWEPKPVVKDTINQYNAPTVILTDAGTGDRTFYADQDKLVRLIVSHFGEAPLKDAVLRWWLTDGDKTVDGGAVPGVDMAIGERKVVGTLTIAAPKCAQPRALVLHASLEQGGKLVNENLWTFCAYPRAASAEIPGIYSEVGPLPGAKSIEPKDPIPGDVRVLITNHLSRKRHGALMDSGKVGIILAQPDQFSGMSENPLGDTYFLNSWGGAFGAIIRDHPVLREIPHGGRLDTIMYGLVTHSKLYPLDKMPQPYADGCSVFGLDLTAWVTVVKDLMRVTMLSDLVADNGLHLLLSGLDITEDRPESRFVLSRMIDYMLSGKPAPSAAKCTSADLAAATSAPATIYLSFDGDDGRGMSLHPDMRFGGPVKFENDRCSIGGNGENARLELPNPVRAGENWSVEYTIQDFDKLAKEIGDGKLVFGLQYTNHSTGTYWRPGSIWFNSPAYPGQFAIGATKDVFVQSLTEKSQAISVPSPAPSRITIKVVLDADKETCDCYAAFGDDATTAKKRASKFVLAAHMPMPDLRWNALPGFVHIATTESSVPVTIDDVIIEGPFGKGYGSPPP